MHVPESDTMANMIAALNARGIVLWREGDEIRYRARRGMLTADILAGLKANKSRLLPLLGTDPAPAPASTPNIVLLERANTSRSAFCVHAVDGSAGSYIELAHELASAGISTYGVQAIDLEGRRPLEDTLASIAARYVQQVRDVHSNGPVHLVGWSLGSLIAFEMACCLSKLGAEVGEVILMDPMVFDDDSSASVTATIGLANNLRSLLPPVNEPNANAWWYFLTLISACIDSSESYPLAPRFWAIDDAGKSEYLFLNRQNALLISPDSMLADARNAGDVLYMFNIVKQQYSAAGAYQPSYFDGKLSLFVSVDDHAFSSEQNDFRAEVTARYWGRQSRGIARVERVAGGHTALIQNPCVADIARLIHSSTA